jgi:hypothetical protein
MMLRGWHTMTLRGVTALAACLMTHLAAPAWAGELAGATLPVQTTIETSTFVLNGTGLHEATRFTINVYVAGLERVTAPVPAYAFGIIDAISRETR